MRILPVEDDLIVRETLAIELRDQSFMVIEAGTGDEAREVDAAAFDVLVTAIRTPGQVKGWQLAEFYRGVRPDLPIRHMTGYSDEPHRRMSGSRLPAKPFRLADILVPRAPVSADAGPGAVPRSVETSSP